MCQEQYEIAIGRSNIYRFLARFFLRAPDEEFVRSVLQDKTLAGIETIFSDYPVQKLRDFQSQFLSSVSIEQLACEYWALFDVPGERYLAPYESVYRKDSVNIHGQPVGLVYGPSTYGVIEAYREAGVEVSAEFLDLPDHIGMELEFLCFLCEREAQKWQEDDLKKATELLNWQRQFLTEHLGVWVDTLCDRMIKNATFDFYRASALMMKEYIAREKSNIPGLLEKAKKM